MLQVPRGSSDIPSWCPESALGETHPSLWRGSYDLTPRRLMDCPDGQWTVNGVFAMFKFALGRWAVDTEGGGSEESAVDDL